VDGCQDKSRCWSVTASVVAITGEPIDSSAAISALAKETIRMRAQRYQRGSLSLMKRKSLPDAWYFRFYTEEDGQKVYKRRFIGTVVELPKRKDAEKAVTQLRVDANEGAAFAPINVEQLVAHFKTNELPEKAYSTQEGYRNLLNHHVLPKWGKYTLASMRCMEVEAWLRGLRENDGKPASPATRAKIRNLMPALFSHAIRHEWALSNPITAVRTSTKRQRTPDILTPGEFQALLSELSQRERVMVLLDAATGLRRGELIALRWRDLDWNQNLVAITRSVWRSVEGETKTEASRKPMPLPPVVIEELKLWRKASIHRSADDYLFPSTQKDGTQPVQPDMILRRHIRPALERLKVTKRIGWHSFRHGFSNLLRQNGVDVKTAQELLRHANSRITLDIYQQTVTEERRAAQALAFTSLMSPPGNQTITNHDLREKEEVVPLSA
jgi:integrase